MSKSLNEVWRQMQIQRQMEQQKQMQIQRQIEEERERSRREYVLQNRMLEKTNITVAAAAAAAGAGGSGNRVIESVTTSTTGNAVLYYTNESGIFSYFIYDFEIGNQSEIFTIESGSFESIYPITDGGFFLRFYNGDTSKNIFYFVNLNGEQTWTDENNDIETYDIEVFSRYVAA